MYSSNLKNDCLVIVLWFYRNQGKFISLRQAEKDTGVARPTISRYIYAGQTYGSENWYLRNIGLQNGYNVIFTGNIGEYIWVEKISATNGD